MTSRYKKPEASPGYLLWRLFINWQNRLNVLLKQHGLTHAQFVYLASLYWLLQNTKEEVTQKNIVDISNLNKVVVSDLTKLLINKKMVFKKSSLKDTRANQIKIYEKGMKIIEEVLPLVESLDIEYFKENTQPIANLLNIIQAIK
jgi:DNA-binding MarR family transcriptional regulator